MKTHVLVFADAPDRCGELCTLLERQGYVPHVESDLARRRAREGAVVDAFDAVLVVGGEGASGVTAGLAAVCDEAAGSEVVLALDLRAQGELAAECLRAGAFAVVDAAAPAEVVVRTVARAVEHRALRQRLASERLSSMGLVAASLAREIDDPTSYVLTNLGFLREALDRLAVAPEGLSLALDRLRRAALEAHEGAQKIRDVVREVGALGRADADPGEPVDLNEAVRSALRVRQTDAQRRGKVSVQLGKDAVVVASLGPLSQVFVDLLTSAARGFAPRSATSSEVALTSRRVGDHVVVEVHHPSPHAPPPEGQRAPSEPPPAARAADGRADFSLTVSREIVRRYGGELHVAGGPGRGVTFTVILPAARTA